jgi:hypothetical protein
LNLEQAIPHTLEDSSPNWGAGIPETSLIISSTGQNQINNWENLIVGFCILLRVYPVVYNKIGHWNIVAYGGFKKSIKLKKKLNSMVWVRERTIPTEQPPLVGEVISNFCG